MKREKYLKGLSLKTQNNNLIEPNVYGYLNVKN
jgi:hypothetical protein